MPDSGKVAVNTASSRSSLFSETTDEMAFRIHTLKGDA